MTGPFFEWTPDDDAGLVVPTASEDGWNFLRRRFCRDRSSPPFERIVEIAKEHGTKSVVVEQRYIDLDFRSEHSHFYSTTFLRYPSVCQRVHFFADPVALDLSNLSSMKEAYRGYSVMRPYPIPPVGRTMLAPPPSLDEAVLCLARDEVHLWGHSFSVVAMPFVSQDQQYFRCAHSALWMMLYHAHLRHNFSRRLPHEIHRAALGGDVAGRQLPSDGLTDAQVLTALYEMGMSSGPTELPRTSAQSKKDASNSLFAILCRHVNSDMPPMVSSDLHAWVVVGYRKRGMGPGHDITTLYRHDDTRGPYLEVESPFGEKDSAYKPWDIAIPPLPLKLYMTGENAEPLGRNYLDNWLESLPGSHPLWKATHKKRLTYRSYSVSSTEFKAEVAARLGEELGGTYRLAHLPRWIWVVELHDRNLLDADEPSCLGEIVIDATASNLSGAGDPVVIVQHLWDEADYVTPDRRELKRVHLSPSRPYRGGGNRWRHADRT